MLGAGRSTEQFLLAIFLLTPIQGISSFDKTITNSPAHTFYVNCNFALSHSFCIIFYFWTMIHHFLLISCRDVHSSIRSISDGCHVHSDFSIRKFLNH